MDPEIIFIVFIAIAIIGLLASMWGGGGHNHLTGGEKRVRFADGTKMGARSCTGSVCSI